MKDCLFSQENVDLMLEAIYRQRLTEVSQAVKSRLVGCQPHSGNFGFMHNPSPNRPVQCCLLQFCEASSLAACNFLLPSTKSFTSCRSVHNHHPIETLGVLAI